MQGRDSNKVYSYTTTSLYSVPCAQECAPVYAQRCALCPKLHYVSVH